MGYALEPEHPLVFILSGFVEANGAIYTFFVPQNIPGLITALGGNKSFTEKLENNFKKAESRRFVTPHGEHGSGWVDYENQPSCHMAHLFSHAGNPWKTQYWVRKVKKITFGGITPSSGYNGDEDQGQMGALGVLMAMGLFDVQGCIGHSPQLELTSPLFDHIQATIPSIKDNDSKIFEIIVTREYPENDIYIQKAFLNGNEWNDFEFPAKKVLDGGKLEIRLDSKPNIQWGKN